MARKNVPNKAKGPVTSDVSRPVGKPIGGPGSAPENLYEWDHGSGVGRLAVVAGEEIPEGVDRKSLVTLKELEKLQENPNEGPALEAVKEGTDAATRARATGDTNDGRALRQGDRETDEQAKVRVAKGGPRMTPKPVGNAPEPEKVAGPLEPLPGEDAS